MKKILLIFVMLCACKISYAQLEVYDNSKEDNVIIALVTNAFNLSKFNDTYVLGIDCTANRLGLNKVPEFVMINLGVGEASAKQSITLLLNMCKGNTIEGTTITDHAGKKFQVSSSTLPDHPSNRLLNIRTEDGFMHSCTITEDALQLLLNKLDKD